MTQCVTLVAFVAVAVAASPALGIAPLITDRPDFTESPSAVATGVFQFEVGATFAEFADSSEATTLGEVLVRWGVLRRLEMRFVLPTYTWADGTNGRRSGFVDSGVGLKYQFADGGGRGVLGGMESGLIVSTTVPTGGAEFSSRAWQPVAIAAAGWYLGSSLGLGVNVGVGRPAADTDRYTTAWASSALGVGVTDDLSLFFELIGSNREEARGPSTATFQTGVVHLLSSDLQIDFRLGRRLADHGVDLPLGAGVSWRVGG